MVEIEHVSLKGDEEDFKALEPLGGSPLGVAHGIAALALNFALKYHDITTVQDGTLYQQYKLEGRNFRELHLAEVFDTAIQMEMHLLGASKRIANLVIDAIATGVGESEEGAPEEGAAPEGGDKQVD